MPIIDVSEFKSGLPANARLFALDVSSNAIGVATADMTLRLVTPVAVIRRGRLADDAVKLSKLIKEYDVSGLVVGWPLNMDGTQGPRCQAVRDTMLELLKKIPPIKVTFQDERLSTREAEALVEEIGSKSRKNKGKTVDSHAALIILQSFLQG
jgi:putative Holliday junction resolvase